MTAIISMRAATERVGARACAMMPWTKEGRAAATAGVVLEIGVGQ